MRRSDLLVHWTGKDIATDLSTLTGALRARYVDRLFDILSNGFFMTTPAETIQGGHPRSTGGSTSFTYHAAMTCFTEVRLSAAAQHAAQYGLLGIAVDRTFVLDRWGSPVHYVRNGSDEHIAASMFDLRYLLQTKLAVLGPAAQEALADAEYLGVFLKAMSSAGTDDFSLIDEHEWRVVYTKQQADKGNIVPGPGTPPFKLLLPPQEVRLVVLPDEGVRSDVLSDPRLKTVLWSHNCYPPLVTLQECGQF